MLDVVVNRGVSDPVEAFYDQHPYPPPITDLGAQLRPAGDARAMRAAHHLIWPDRPVDDVRSVLVAGCGTSQAVRAAIRHPQARVVGIDVSAPSLAHTTALAAHHGVTNLSVRQLPIERVAELDRHFDHIICTGVLHHLTDPLAGLRQLGRALAPRGAITLMVYAKYGRAGVYMIQDYCRRLGIGTSPGELAELVDTLRELPMAHPLRRLLQESRDFRDDDAIADALCNPRDRAYSVPELLDLITRAGLRFGRWERQAPYLPDCGAISETPHAKLLDALPPAEQYAAVELFRGTITRHTAILFGAGDRAAGGLDLADAVDGLIPVRVPTATAVTQRLPAGAAAALINRAHVDTDLVLFADRQQHQIFERIDGSRTVGDLGQRAAGFVVRLWRHDLVVFDATRMNLGGSHE